ncbi:MAG: hypothetical protein WAM69_08360 [Candidatus Sulfotelmatobacter sp.]
MRQNRKAARCNDYTQGKQGAASSAAYDPAPNCYTGDVPENTRRAKLIRIAIGVLLGAVLAASDTGALEPVHSSSSPTDSASAIALVRAAVANEVAASNDTSIKHMFSSRKQTPQGSQTRLYVETREAMAGMTVAYNDEPLTPEQMSSERARLAGLMGNPEQLSRKHSKEQENAEHTLRIVKALPDAFLFDYDGEEKGSADLGKEGDRLVRLKFRPNPVYEPPSHVEQVLAGMQGVVLIDPAAHRIARIDGTLFKEVGFGWGILGHLDQGGHFLVEQRELGDGSWEISHMALGFTGKILLFKNIAIKSDEVFSDFRRVPADTTFAQGVDMLKAEEAKLAQNHKPLAATPDPKPH